MFRDPVVENRQLGGIVLGLLKLLFIVSIIAHYFFSWAFALTFVYLDINNSKRVRRTDCFSESAANSRAGAKRVYSIREDVGLFEQGAIACALFAGSLLPGEALTTPIFPGRVLKTPGDNN